MLHTGIDRRKFIVRTAALAGSRILPAFAEGKVPNIRIGILSDVHVCDPGRSADVYRKALEYFRDQEVDGVIVSGDLAIWGNVRELEHGAKIWFDVFPDDKLPDGRHVERLFCTGNHDDDGWAYPGAIARWKHRTMEEAKSDSFYFHREEMWKRIYHEDWAPIFLKDVKGYKFVLRNWVSILGRESVQHRIAAGCEDAPSPIAPWFAAHGGELPDDRPFFYVQHDHPAGTCSSPFVDGQDRGESTAVLKGYPNCIAFSGHSHTSIIDERTIWQGEFTSVGCSSTCGFAFTFAGRENGFSCKDMDSDWKQEMPKVANQHCRQGMLMEVYDDRIVLHRRDFEYDREAAPDWVIPLGAGAAKPYRQEPRIAASRPPVFPEDAKVELRKIKDGQNRAKEKHPQIEVRFPPIGGLDGRGDRAVEFEVVAETRIDGLVRTCAMKRVYSPNVLLPAVDEKDPVTCLFAASDIPGGRDLEVRYTVVPLNEWGKRGKPISTVFMPSDDFETRER